MKKLNHHTYILILFNFYSIPILVHLPPNAPWAAPLMESNHVTARGAQVNYQH